MLTYAGPSMRNSVLTWAAPDILHGTLCCIPIILHALQYRTKTTSLGPETCHSLASDTGFLKIRIAIVNLKITFTLFWKTLARKLPVDPTADAQMFFSCQMAVNTFGEQMGPQGP